MRVPPGPSHLGTGEESLIPEAAHIRLAEGRQFSDISASSFPTQQGFTPAVLCVKNASRTLVVALISLKNSTKIAIS